MRGPTNEFVGFPRDDLAGSLPERIGRVVAEFSDRIAVKSRGRAVSYGQLEQEASELACTLIGALEDDPRPIALLLEHDCQFVISVVAALKTGRPYVPLDPRYPAARLSYLVTQSSAAVLVTDQANRELAATLAGDDLRMIVVDDSRAGSRASSSPIAIVSDMPAVLHYTSGSTGDPKGVIHTHRTVLHEVMNYTNGIHLSAQDRLLLISSFSFTDSLRTLYAALCNGAALSLFDVKQEGFRSLARWIVGEGITVYRSVTTTFRHLVNQLGSDWRFPTVRVAYLGGEPVYAPDLAGFKRHFLPGAFLVNALGTTETLTFRWSFWSHEDEVAGTHVPVGFALDDKETLLLDGRGRPVDVGQPGEISVKSQYLSPGFWARPDLTDEAFVRDPVDPQMCTYRTGDVGRLTADGCLTHLGRTDFQIKVRGYRVEPIEVEHALTRLPSIQDAVAVDREDRSGTLVLTAYVVPADGEQPTVSALRSHLASCLPDYMVPSAYVQLPALPTTPSGKVNRRALPPLERVRPLLDTPSEAPHDRVQEALTKIWSEVLELDGIGIHDRFLDLGGDSLRATRVVSRVIERFDMEVPVRILFDAATIAEMARALEDFLPRE